MQNAEWIPGEGIGKIPSPGERVAPKGSGEECGR